jgi:hypothetical protein
MGLRRALRELKQLPARTSNCCQVRDMAYNKFTVGAQVRRSAIKKETFYALPIARDAALPTDPNDAVG